MPGDYYTDCTKRKVDCSKGLSRSGPKPGSKMKAVKPGTPGEETVRVKKAKHPSQRKKYIRT